MDPLTKYKLVNVKYTINVVVALEKFNDAIDYENQTLLAALENNIGDILQNDYVDVDSSVVCSDTDLPTEWQTYSLPYAKQKPRDVPMEIKNAAIIDYFAAEAKSDSLLDAKELLDRITYLEQELKKLKQN